MADQQNITGGQYTQTLLVNNSLMTNATVLTPRNQPSIDKYDFYKLIDDTGTWKVYAQGLSGAAIGFVINMLAKLVGGKLNAKVTFDLWEVYACGIAAVLSAACYIINSLTNNDRKQIIKKFKDHFDAN